MMLSRQRDWRAQLHRWARQQLGAPFVWGETDCASLARQALTVMFGEDLLPELPRWSTAREAVAVLAQHGAGVGLLVALGAQEVSLSFIRAGDIVVTEEVEETVGHAAYMVCLDRLQCITSTTDGVGVLNAEPPCRVFSLWEVQRG